jgi:hypothetical protein
MFRFSFKMATLYYISAPYLLLFPFMKLQINFRATNIRIYFTNQITWCLTVVPFAELSELPLKLNPIQFISLMLLPTFRMLSTVTCMECDHRRCLDW